MELVKDIYFNTDKLVENTKVKVSYTGKFYQGNNDKVFLHYGYGKDWNNINEIEMAKTDLGYQAELDLVGKDTINFCFKNQNNEWDNNFGQNYIFDIEKKANVQEKQENNIVFLGKTFGKKDDAQQDTSIIYWNPEKINNDEKNSGVLEDLSNTTPNSIDTVIPNNCDSVVAPNALGVTLEKPAENDCFAVIKTSFGNTDVDGVAKSGITDFDLGDNTQTSTKVVQNNTAIALAPTGFSYWTKKIKENVCKFFEYIPKLISGNYKRNIDNSTEIK